VFVDTQATEEPPVDTEATEALWRDMPFAATLGAEVVASSPGEVRGRLAWTEERCTGGGMLHGGAIMALADTCGASCAYLNLPEGALGTATVESKTNFFHPVRRGWVQACARPLHVGRTLIVVETDVTDERSQRVARVTQTQVVLR